MRQKITLERFRQIREQLLKILDDLNDYYEEHLKEIERVIELVGSTDNTSAIKALCPPDINYAEINLVVRNRR